TGTEPSAAPAHSPEDEALLAKPAAAAVWAWLKRRFPGRTLALDMSPQLDLGIDSLGWVDLTLILEREQGVTLTERDIGRIVTLRDLLQEAVAAKSRPAAVEPQRRELPRLGPWRPLLQAGGALIQFVLRWKFRLAVAGADALPSSGGFLICPNHASYLDPFAIAAALGPRRLPRVWWGGWTGILYSTALRRRFSRVAQIVPVDQYRGGGASLGLAAQVFARGNALVWFPEGGLSRDGKLQRFQPGVGLLVARHRVPVVPAVIEGTYESWPADRRFQGYHPIRVRFGKALGPEALVATAGDDPQGIADLINEAVQSLRSNA
ncbi:MAG: 1-acyl-sn-glycerol-3-phosphate acyltransferase, partial [Stellaceae bacterium]